LHPTRHVLLPGTILDARSRAARTVSCISGAGMILIGLSLLIEHLVR
jgi:hypothetical protein